ncbi:MAG: thioredoxin domain-containing protein [Thermoanaerobaculia bacterium]
MKSFDRFDLRRCTGFMGCLVLAFALVACSVSETPIRAEKSDGAEAESGTTDAGGKVLAIVAGEEITEAEVEEVVAAQLLKVDRERHQIIERGVSQVVATRLFEKEAEAQGLSVAELLEKEVSSKVVPPTDEEVDAFYQENQAQIRQPKEQVSVQIHQHLVQQQTQEGRMELLAALEEKYGSETFIEPLRLEVESEGHPSMGPADAPITIVEFSDFQCPYCSRVLPTLEKVSEEYGDRIRVVFRQFPLLNIHPLAQKAAEASLCAFDQDKFWEMHDAMFADQKGLGVDQLKAKAVTLGLDAAVFDECLDSNKYADQVEEDLRAGSRMGVTGTPAVFINGRFLSGAQPFEAFAAIIDKELE